MKIEINIPENVSKKLAALSVLTGKKASDMESLLVDMIESNINQRILEAIGMTTLPATQPGAFSIPQPRAVATMTDTTGISDGLGDEDAEIAEGLQEMDALVPPGAGPTEAELDNEMRVEEPGTEAKASAASIKSVPPKTKKVEIVDGESVNQAYGMTDQEGLELFADAAGIPKEIDHRIAKRQKRLVGGARVSALEAAPRDIA